MPYPVMPGAPITSLSSVTPNDGTDLTDVRAIYFPGPGVARLLMVSDVATIDVTVVQGWYPLAVKRVYATGTTVTGTILVGK